MKALILIDIQNDFLPGGALAVPRGDEVVPVANREMPHYPLVIATQDWHPANHGSFAANHTGRQVYDQVDLDGLPQRLWPVHCVENTPGAELAPALNRAAIHHVIRKGTDPRIDSYSGFYDNGHRRSTGMGEWLKAQGITELALMGLATDYCVLFSALDAVRLGFSTSLIVEGCRAVEVTPGDSDRALAQMAAAGVQLLR